MKDTPAEKKFSNPFVQHGKIDEIKDRSNESESLWAHRPLNGLDGKSVRTNKRIGSVVVSLHRVARRDTPGVVCATPREMLGGVRGRGGDGSALLALRSRPRESTSTWLILPVAYACLKD